MRHKLIVAAMYDESTRQVIDKIPTPIVAWAAVSIPVWQDRLAEVSGLAASLGPILVVVFLLLKIWREFQRPSTPAEKQALTLLPDGPPKGLFHRYGRPAIVVLATILGGLFLFRFFRKGTVDDVIADGATAAAKAGGKLAKRVSEDDDGGAAVATGTAAGAAIGAAIATATWMKFANAERGVVEGRGKKNNPRVMAYYAKAGHSWVKEDSVAWCAAFACWALEEAGIRSPRNLAAKSFLNWGTALAAPKPGCIVVMDRPGASAAHGHVGFYVGPAGNGHIYVLGGNQSDAVNVKKFPVSRVRGYRWPARVYLSAANVSLGVASLGAVSLAATAAADLASPISNVGEQLRIMGADWPTLAAIGTALILASHALTFYMNIKRTLANNGAQS